MTRLLACAAVMLSACLAAHAGPVALTLSGDTVTFSSGELSSTSTVARLVSVYWANTPDIWAARAWVELPADAERVTARQRGDRVEISYPSFGGRGIRVELVGTVDAKAREVRWAMSVRNRTQGTLVGIAGPVLRELSDLPGGIIYYPNRPGQLLRNPWKVLQAGTTSMAYPVPASMQYLVYTGRRDGVAYHVLDRSMTYKLFAFGGPEREMRTLQMAFLAPGASWEVPTVVWQALAGDWHAAADRYGAWFRSWAQEPRVSRLLKRLPTFGAVVVKARPVDDPHLRDVVKAQEHGTYEATLEECLRLGKAGFQGMHLVGWFGQGHDTTYPDFDPSPEMGGVEGLKGLVKGMQDIGMQVTLYLNAHLANVAGPTLAAHPDWKVLQGEGPYWYEKYGDQEFTVLCPGARGFQEKMRTEVLRVARDYRGDGVQLDQVGAATTLLCFDRTHGHRTPATAWAEGYAAMLTDLRDSARKVNPDFYQWVEGAWEGSGQYIDMTQGGFWPMMPGAEAFPRMYRYTNPDHPMFGDPGSGSVPYWSPTDIHRAMRINDVIGPLFWSAQYMDDLGLSTERDAEALWFKGDGKAIVTFRNLATTDRDISARLDLRRTSQTSAPRSARALAAGQDVAVTLERGRLRLTAPVPARQVEAVLLEW